MSPKRTLTDVGVVGPSRLSYDRIMLCRAFVAACLLAPAASAYASSASAPLLVTLTVVRSCAVQTGADLVLRCSTAVGQPRIDSADRSAPAGSIPPPAARAAQPAPGTRFITINF